ncbi:MAG TPA: SRPBCC domain-containing protein [Ignavibacteria bacterium]|nr:SRPBCC domain-containing protein [Ignavibacteria bacterium]HMR40723.1 SRPBCC domain-containing protein [Ignavibacteria bacterium]
MKTYNYNALHEKTCPGKVHYTVGIVIRSDLKTVWENVCKADMVKQYFTTDARRDLDKCGEALWVWGQEAALLNVIEVYPNEKIIFEWNGTNVDYRIRTEFTFENVSGRVKIKIKESGWDGDESGAKSAFANCSGWTEFLNALKVFTEYKISYLNK